MTSEGTGADGRGARATGGTPPVVDPRHRLANALRETITAAVAADVPREAVVAAAEAVEEVNRVLAESAGPEKRRKGTIDFEGEPQRFFPTSPIIGLANPLAPPVLIHVVEGADGSRELAGTATFDYAYEGPPTCVHGGVIAETFDEILGAVLLANSTPAMTGTLTVRYRKPTPLRTELRLVARCLRQEGRKVYPWAGMYHGDVLTAEAEGVFIEVNPPKFLAVAEHNAADADPTVLAAIREAALRIGAASDVHPGSDLPEIPTTEPAGE